MTTKSEWMSPDLHGLLMKVKATDGKTLMDVFRSAAREVLKALSLEKKDNLTLEDGLTVIGNDLTAPGDGNEQEGKMVECSVYKQLHGKDADYVPRMFVPRYMARMKEGKVIRGEDKKPVLVGNFVPVLNKTKGEWLILAAEGNPFWSGSPIHKLRELGLTMPMGKLLPALTYAEAVAFVERATAKHQANVAKTQAQKQEREQLASAFVGQRERREGPEGGISKPRFVSGRGKRK